jgi:hypothetical protein
VAPEIVDAVNQIVEQNARHLKIAKENVVGFSVLMAYILNSSKVLVITDEPEKMRLAFVEGDQNYLLKSGCIKSESLYYYAPSCAGIFRENFDSTCFFSGELVISTEFNKSFPPFIDLIIVENQKNTSLIEEHFRAGPDTEVFQIIIFLEPIDSGKVSVTLSIKDEAKFRDILFE